MQLIPMKGQSDVAAARRIAAGVARAAGFGAVDEGRAALVATELAGNLVRHARGGEFLVQGGEEGAACVEMLALDRGPGMADITACLRDGFSTAGTPGTGLGAIQRQSETFDVQSLPGVGSIVLARLWRGRLAPAPPLDGRLASGVVNLPKVGEQVCGDSWGLAAGPNAAALLVADGLGHGPLAAAASLEAVRLFRRAPFGPPAEVLQVVHAGLRPTRGAAVAVARLELGAAELVFAGIGNIAGAILAGGEVRRLPSMSGTAGHTAQRIREFRYPIAGNTLLVLCSDGLLTSWSLDRYPGVAGRDPLLIAGLLYRDFNRGRDDVTVAVLKVAAP